MPSGRVVLPPPMAIAIATPCVSRFTSCCKLWKADELGDEVAWRQVARLPLASDVTNEVGPVWAAALAAEVMPGAVYVLLAVAQHHLIGRGWLSRPGHDRGGAGEGGAAARAERSGIGGAGDAALSKGGAIRPAGAAPWPNAELLAALAVLPWPTAVVLVLLAVAP